MLEHQILVDDANRTLRERTKLRPTLRFELDPKGDPTLVDQGHRRRLISAVGPTLLRQLVDTPALGELVVALWRTARVEWLEGRSDGIRQAIANLDGIAEMAKAMRDLDPA